MIVGSRKDAVNAHSLVASEYGGARLTPRLLSDGRHALPPAVLTDSAYAAATTVLSGWSSETPASGDYVTLPEGATGAPPFGLLVDGKVMVQSGRRASLTQPQDNVFRFEVRVDDFAWPGDSSNGNRRSEITTMPGLGFGAVTVWSSFCLIFSDYTPGSLSNDFGIVHQWHSVDTSFARSPVLAVATQDNLLKFDTRSSASLSGGNGVQQTRYSMSIPAKGVRTHIVLQATLGQTGHLNAWVNGSQVINLDIPIGYYADLTDGSGRAELGYPMFGLYTRNRAETNIVYNANPEWGTADLSARITSPLAVPNLDIDTYPAAGMYPAADLYPLGA